MSPTRLLGLALVVAAIALGIVVAVRGGDDDAPTLTVYGASSLKQALPALDDAARYSFAGSDTLAEQIRQGAPADVFAAASPRYPRLLRAEGRCSEPVPFASNTLALILPAENAAVASLDDLRSGPPRRLAIGAAAVPIGIYTREALTMLGAKALLAVVASPLPAAAEPTVIYMACAVLREGAPSAAATAYLELLTGPTGQRELAAAGFEPVP
jgi:molybdate transport system substrate-binding protein